MMAVMLGLRFVRSRSGFVWPPDRSISILVFVKMFQQTRIQIYG